VGIWLSEYLKKKGISPDQTYLVGHSWGSYAAYQTASDLGHVQGIVALDPARTGVGYDVGAIDFAGVSDMSWAFYATGPFGSPQLSATADESFTLATTTAADPFSLHSFAVDWFETLIGEFVPAEPEWAALFSLVRFETGMISDEWAFDRYRDETSVPPSEMTFEGIFEVTTPTIGDPSTWEITRFRYIDPMTELELSLDAPV
jgi:pimeloyl-ACP methyl ester carboxylesterase